MFVFCNGTDDLGSSELGDKFPNIYKEIELFVRECGFSPLAAITSVTKTAAQAIWIDKKYSGTIEPGKVVDLVILYGDPSIDMTNTRKVYSFIRQGIFYNGCHRNDMSLAVLSIPLLILIWLSLAFSNIRLVNL